MGSAAAKRKLRNLGDLHTESGQTLQGAFSAVSKSSFATSDSLESSRRDLHDALRATALKSQMFIKMLLTVATFEEILLNVTQILLNLAGIRLMLTK